MRVETDRERLKEYMGFNLQEGFGSLALFSPLKVITSTSNGPTLIKRMGSHKGKTDFHVSPTMTFHQTFFTIFYVQNICVFVTNFNSRTRNCIWSCRQDFTFTRLSLLLWSATVKQWYDIPLYNLTNHFVPSSLRKHSAPEMIGRRKGTAFNSLLCHLLVKKQRIHVWKRMNCT